MNLKGNSYHKDYTNRNEAEKKHETGYMLKIYDYKSLVLWKEKT